MLNSIIVTNRVTLKGCVDTESLETFFFPRISHTESTSLENVEVVAKESLRLTNVGK